MLAIAATAAPATAQDSGIIVAASGADTAWVLVAALLVLTLALPGIAALRPAGARAVGAAVAAVSLIWVLAGYTLAFGDPVNGWIGNGRAWILNNLDAVRGDLLVPESAFAVFGLAAACVPAAFVAAAIAPRARIGWIALFAALWTATVYAPVAHWLWGGGWLVGKLGALDFAGGIVLQVTAGIAALVAALLAGRKVDENAAVTPSVWAAGLVWIGWLALIGGSAMSAGDAAAAAIINGQIGAALGAITWLVLGRTSAAGTASEGWTGGLVAGLCAVSAGAGFVGPGGAAVIAFAGSLAAFYAHRALAPRLRLGGGDMVFCINAIPAMVGAVLLAIFLAPALGGIGYLPGASMGSQIAAQLIAVAVVTLWTAVASAILALLVSIVIPLRQTAPQE